MNVFVDTNLWLDVALQRHGLVEGTEKALLACESREDALWVSWHTLSNLFYVLRRDRGAELSLKFLQRLISVAVVATVQQADAARAFTYGLTDFEDALQLSAAEACKSDVLLTRNKNDFRGSPIPVMTPEEFVAQLN